MDSVAPMLQTCVESGSSYTYAQARRLSHGVARALAGGLGGLQRGLAKGDVVAVVAPNTPEYVFAAHGAIEAGLTVTFVNPLYTPGIAAPLTGRWVSHVLRNAGGFFGTPLAPAVTRLV